jgi:hypothetical protein
MAPLGCFRRFGVSGGSAEPNNPAEGIACRVSVRYSP